MSPIVLVHGAWMESSCWRLVQDRLESKGFKTVAKDLPGHGQDQTPLAELSLQAYVNQTIATAEGFGEPVTLVGHSMAGIVLTQAAEQRPDLFKELVYLAAYLPVDGQSLNDLAMTDADSSVGPNLRPATDWSTLDIAEEARKDLFFHDVDPGLASAFLANWKAEPTAAPSTAVQRTEANFGRVPRRYIQTSLDRVVSPGLQARMLEATATPSVMVEAGHAAMLSKAEEVAEIVASGS